MAVYSAFLCTISFPNKRISMYCSEVFCCLLPNLTPLLQLYLTRNEIYKIFERNIFSIL